jgi:hypothetical protein
MEGIANLASGVRPALVSTPKRSLFSSGTNGVSKKVEALEAINSFLHTFT